MQAIVQRVIGETSILIASASGEPEKRIFSGPGLVVLLGWEKEDETRKDLESTEEWIRNRCEGLRIFPDREGKMNLSLAQYLANEKPGAKDSGGILWVSQFTLTANLESGFRPSFTDAMHPQLASLRYALFKERIEKAAETFSYKNIFGKFGGDMTLTFSNWGPVTIPLKK